VQRANQFIVNLSNPREQIETVRFLLLNGYCGINNRTGIQNILDHLENQGISLSRESFQNQVLTELKRKGIVATLVYPSRQGGVFIPCNENEIRIVAEQVFKRIIQELTNLEGTVAPTSILQLITSAKQEMERLKRQI
jgi:hypothetical protein